MDANEAKTPKPTDAHNEEVSLDYYRPYTFRHKSAGRRETRDFLRSKARFIPMHRGDRPLTKAAMKLFFQPRDEG